MAVGYLLQCLCRYKTTTKYIEIRKKTLAAPVHEFWSESFKSLEDEKVTFFGLEVGRHTYPSATSQFDFGWDIS
jgi:hypothetical protein